MVQQSIVHSPFQAGRSLPDRHGSGVRTAVVHARGFLDRIGRGAASPLLMRPRFMRGPGLEQPVIARPTSTPRLVLRPHQMEDATRWHDLVSEPGVRRHLSWPERDAAASQRHLRDRTRHTRLWQADDFLALGVTHDGVLIGDVSLHLRTVAAEIRAVEIGWLLSPDHEGKGFALEAVRALLEIAFSEVGARMVLAVIELGNARSLALAARLGFREVDRGTDTQLFMLTADAQRPADQAAHRRA